MHEPADRPHTPEDTERIVDELAWEAEERWWRENYQSRSYVSREPDFDDYSPAYRYGFESAGHYHGREWNDVEPELRDRWIQYEYRGRMSSNWTDVRDVVHDAWNHLRGREHDRHVDRTMM